METNGAIELLGAQEGVSPRRERERGQVSFQNRDKVQADLLKTSESYPDKVRRRASPEGRTA